MSHLAGLADKLLLNIFRRLPGAELAAIALTVTGFRGIAEEVLYESLPVTDADEYGYLRLIRALIEQPERAAKVKSLRIILPRIYHDVAFRFELDTNLIDEMFVHKVLEILSDLGIGNDDWVDRLKSGKKLAWVGLLLAITPGLQALTLTAAGMDHYQYEESFCSFDLAKTLFGDTKKIFAYDSSDDYDGSSDDSNDFSDDSIDSDDSDDSSDNFDKSSDNPNNSSEGSDDASNIILSSGLSLEVIPRLKSVKELNFIVPSSERLWCTLPNLRELELNRHGQELNTALDADFPASNVRTLAIQALAMLLSPIWSFHPDLSQSCNLLTAVRARLLNTPYGPDENNPPLEIPSLPSDLGKQPLSRRSSTCTTILANSGNFHYRTQQGRPQLHRLVSISKVVPALPATKIPRTPTRCPLEPKSAKTRVHASDFLPGSLESLCITMPDESMFQFLHEMLQSKTSSPRFRKVVLAVRDSRGETMERLRSSPLANWDDFEIAGVAVELMDEVIIRRVPW